MKLSTIKKLLTILILTISISLFSQQTPDNKYDLGGNIDFMTLSDAGILIVGHGKGLAGIKPGQDALVFNFEDYGKVKQEEVVIIPNTPYVTEYSKHINAMIIGYHLLINFITY